MGLDGWNEFPSSTPNKCIKLLVHGMTPFRISDGMSTEGAFRIGGSKIVCEVKFFSRFMDIIVRYGNNGASGSSH